MLLVALGGAFFVTTSADDLGNKQNQRAAVAAQMAAIRAQITAAQNQTIALTAIIARVQTQIGATQDAMNAAQTKLDGINADLANAEDHLQIVQDQLTADKKALAHQIVVVYEMGAQSTTVSNMFGAKDFNAFVDSLDTARRVADSQHTLTTRAGQEQIDVEKTVASIGAAKIQQQGVLTQLRDTAAELASEVDTEHQAQVALAAAQAADQARLQDLQAAAAQLDAQIAELQAEQAAAAANGGGSGQFGWPLSGPITQGFGCTPYPFEPYSASCASHHFHSGLDIAAGCGTPIHAADSGVVNTYRTWGGYGNYVIMVHGNGWSTVYGHMASFAVNNGQGVARGQVIGYEGSTGNSTGCHVHFEVRYNNDPRSPLQYLP